MKPEQIKSIMQIAAANGDIGTYKRMRDKLMIIEAKEVANERLGKTQH